MHYLFGFLCICALGVVPLVGCSETTGDGGSGGTAGGGGTGGDGGMGGDGGTGGIPECESAEDCDDENECTTDACDAANSSCENTPVREGSSCAADRGGCYGGLCNFVPVSVAFGARKVVFDWSNERCEEFDIPDGPAKAVRASDGEVVLFGTIH
jgi:hypothetical protein